MPPTSSWMQVPTATRVPSTGAKRPAPTEERPTMTEISRATLFGKLNPLAYRAIESATVFCKLRGNPYVELVHWLHQILQTQDSDLHRVIKAFNLDASQLVADTQAA